jgi:hypothetical protein
MPRAAGSWRWEPFSTQDGLVAALEEVSASAMAAVEVLGVGAIELPHGLGEVGLGRLHQEVKMVAHQHKRVHTQAMGADHRREPPKEARAVAVVSVHGLSLVAPRGDVVEGARKLHPQWPGHREHPLRCLISYFKG